MFLFYFINKKETQKWVSINPPTFTTGLSHIREAGTSYATLSVSLQHPQYRYLYLSPSGPGSGEYHFDENIIKQ